METSSTTIIAGIIAGTICGILALAVAVGVATKDWSAYDKISETITNIIGKIFGR